MEHLALIVEEQILLMPIPHSKEVGQYTIAGTRKNVIVHESLIDSHFGCFGLLLDELFG